MTAAHLKNYFALNGMTFDRFIIETSPFLRTMMTASKIATEFGISEVIVNYQICETLGLHTFKQDPMPHLEYVTGGGCHIENDGIEYIDSNAEKPNYEENHEEEVQRCLRLRKHMNQTIKQASASG
mgnify:CR=1 FL=1